LNELKRLVQIHNPIRYNFPAARLPWKGAVTRAESREVNNFFYGIRLHNTFRLMSTKHFILYAEDDPDDLFMVKQAFEAHNHIEVVHALNGMDALHRLHEMAAEGILPCLVILDINMPVMDGREALQKLKSYERFQRLPVVLFSTSNSPGDQAFAASHRVELITKPLSFSDLQAIAETFVEKCDFQVNAVSRS
jgi:CheY-like chemotaxis protein